MATGDVCRAHGCAECCHEIEMPLTEDDAARLEARGHRRADFAFVDDDGTLLLVNVDAPEGRRHCYFLRGGACSVYADRPAGCRIYPFVLDVDLERAVRDEDCPWRQEFPHDPAATRRLHLVHGKIQDEARRRLRDAGRKGS